MEKNIKLGKATYKVYDLFFFIALVFGAIFVAAIDGLSTEIDIPPILTGILVIGIEMVYIFGVINKRAKKKK